MAALRSLLTVAVAVATVSALTVPASAESAERTFVAGNGLFALWALNCNDLVQVGGVCVNVPESGRTYVHVYAPYGVCMYWEISDAGGNSLASGQFREGELKHYPLPPGASRVAVWAGPFAWSNDAFDLGPVSGCTGGWWYSGTVYFEFYNTRAS